MLSARLNRGMLTQAIRLVGSNLVDALWLGGVRHPVPHDRTDDLQPLSWRRLERLAVRHVSLSAPGVAVTLPLLCSGEAVA